MSKHIAGVPSLVREVLYAPQAPPAVAQLLEVALTYHNGGNHEAAINTYMKGLSEWENVLRIEHFPELVEAENTTFMQRMKKEQQRAPRMVTKKSKSEATKNATTGSLGSGGGGVLGSNDNNEGSDGDDDGEVVEDEASIRERARQEQEEAERRQKHVEAVHKAHELVPVEGKLFLSLAVGAVYESAANDERALAEYLVALRTLQTIPVFQSTLLAATVYASLGGAYFHLSQYDFAADYYFRALEIREALLPEKHIDIASMLNNIASVLFLLDRPSDALTLFYRAQSIVEDQLHASHPRRELIDNNIRRAKKSFFQEPSGLAPVPFVPVTVPMIPGALKNRKQFQPKPKKKKDADKKKGK